MFFFRDFKDDFYSDMVFFILNEQCIWGILCDVIIIVEDIKFKVYSNVLVVLSLYFKNIFWSYIICIFSYVLELDDFKVEVFIEIFNYIYSFIVVVKRQEIVIDFVVVGKKLGILFLEDFIDCNFLNFLGFYVFCIIEKGVVKEEKNEKRYEELVIINGLRIINVFFIIEIENSNNMFFLLDLRVSFKKVFDFMRIVSFCLERMDVCYEVEFVCIFVEYLYVVFFVVEVYRSQFVCEYDGSLFGNIGKENCEVFVVKLKICWKLKIFFILQDLDLVIENILFFLVFNLEVN